MHPPRSHHEVVRQYDYPISVLKDDDVISAHAQPHACIVRRHRV